MTSILISLTLLALCLLASLIFLYIELRRNHRQQQALMATNQARERYVALCLDLAAANIDKMRYFQNQVKRKVMARQYDDLLRLVSTGRLGEDNTREFFVNFDTAFLRLYPDFIASFNGLLREDAQIHPTRGELLTTELRIYALYRMGVKDSSKMATLLFYSPQTIYNYRTAIKNKAKDKERFEQQVLELCRI
jgi:DNA-binding CsgD family transcriptional regulator